MDISTLKYNHQMQNIHKRRKCEMKKTALFLSAALMTGMLFGVTVKAEEWSGDVDHIVMT